MSFKKEYENAARNREIAEAKKQAVRDQEKLQQDALAAERARKLVELEQKCEKYFRPILEEVKATLKLADAKIGFDNNCLILEWGYGEATESYELGGSYEYVACNYVAIGFSRDETIFVEVNNTYSHYKVGKISIFNNWRSKVINRIAEMVVKPSIIKAGSRLVSSLDN